MRKIACLPDDDRRELFRNTADKMGLNDVQLYFHFQNAKD